MLDLRAEDDALAFDQTKHRDDEKAPTHVGAFLLQQVGDGIRNAAFEFGQLNFSKNALPK